MEYVVFGIFLIFLFFWLKYFVFIDYTHLLRKQGCIIKLGSKCLEYTITSNGNLYDVLDTMTIE